jgi:hypothetical protein
MNEWWRKIVNLLVAAALAVSAAALLPGCKKEGPVERAGEEVDEAVEEVGEAVD